MQKHPIETGNTHKVAARQQFDSHFCWWVASQVERFDDNTKGAMPQATGLRHHMLFSGNIRGDKLQYCDMYILQICKYQKHCMGVINCHLHIVLNPRQIVPQWLSCFTSLCLLLLSWLLLLLLLLFGTWTPQQTCLGCNS